MLWSIILRAFKREPWADIINGEERIATWDSVYRGKQDWLKYSYVDMYGNRRERIRKTMNAAKLMTREMASLIWAEKPELDIDEAVNEVLTENRFFENIPAKTDRFLALGGMTLKLYVENSKIKIDYVPAHRMIPVSWDDSGVYEADFIDRHVIDKKEYYRVEEHRKTTVGKGETAFTITNRLLWKRGDKDFIEVPLSKLGKEIDPETIIVSPVPLFSYIRNPEENNFDVDSPLGISMYGNALDTLESLDVAFDALQSEIILGKKRIIVPVSAVRVVYDGDGNNVRYFDPHDETFVAFNEGDKEELKIQDNSVELRIDEIRLAIQTLLDILSIQVGFSAGYLSFDGSGGVKTATEVISDNSKTFKTKQSFENALGLGIMQLCEGIRVLGRSYGLRVSDKSYSINWNDSIIEDRNSTAAYWANLKSAGLTPLYKALMNIHGLSEEDAKAMAEEILSENATVDVAGMFGGVE